MDGETAASQLTRLGRTIQKMETDEAEQGRQIRRSAAVIEQLEKTVREQRKLIEAHEAVAADWDEHAKNHESFSFEEIVRAKKAIMAAIEECGGPVRPTFLHQYSLLTLVPMLIRTLRVQYKAKVEARKIIDSQCNTIRQLRGGAEPKQFPTLEKLVETVQTNAILSLVEQRRLLESAARMVCKYCYNGQEAVLLNVHADDSDPEYWHIREHEGEHGGPCVVSEIHKMVRALPEPVETRDVIAEACKIR